MNVTHFTQQLNSEHIITEANDKFYCVIRNHSASATIGHRGYSHRFSILGIWVRKLVVPQPA